MGLRAAGEPVSAGQVAGGWVRVIGLALVIVGGFCVAVGVIGDFFLKGDVTSSYADPREPVELEPGTYPVDWVGPAKGWVPFPSDLDVQLQMINGEATWRESSVEMFESVGPSGEDRGRSPIGTVHVQTRSTLSIDFNPSIPTKGEPRLLVRRAEDPIPESRSGPLVIGGVALVVGGFFVRGRGDG